MGRPTESSAVGTAAGRPGDFRRILEFIEYAMSKIEWPA